ncbi:C40 family peptidase [Nocardioides donggukensis]|uniref:C40 family peptidase n=1 Tax=Nocardioides donggukensis TaxID=2774019 RepID=A0A927Q0P2_9ACTN|nr:C40 family peptidase [Nocardioides donggukensis]MBD8870885.1 C40 family peptidase [Nocardioides donggukensis]
MRRQTVGRRCGLAVLTGVMLLGTTAPLAGAAPGEAPSKDEVAAAQEAAGAKSRDVAAVQTDLVLANERLQASGVRAAQAAEAYNASRWQLAEARREVRRAEADVAVAVASLGEHERGYGDVLASAYEMSPEMTALAAMVGEDGIDGVVEQANTMYSMTSAMDEAQAGYEAALDVAGLATDRAERARSAAAELEAAAAEKRDAARSEQRSALAEATAVTREKERLIAELARLQDISVSLASQRQSALEAAAQQRAADAAAAEQQASDAAAAAASEASASGGDTPAASQPAPNTGGGSAAGSQPDRQPAPEPAPAPAPQPDPQPSPQPDPQPTPAPQPDPAPPPPSVSGAQRAIAFAKQQLGEPYRWGAAGPGAWDCSGLTMRAWQQGGKSLPHYSVGQYSAGTAIGSSQLRAGDLVFWGSSSSPSSIYHVGLYIGNGQMIHAPRTGRPVVQESIYYWIPPNFFARP